MITWSTWGHSAISKIYTSFITRLMVSKPYMVLPYGRRFSAQTLKSLPTFFFFLFFWSLFLDWLTKVFQAISEFLGEQSCRTIESPSLDTPANYCVQCALEIKTNRVFKRGHSESCPSITKNIISPLAYRLLPPIWKSWWVVIRVSHSQNHMAVWSRDLARLRDKLKPFYLQYHRAYSHHIWWSVDLHYVRSVRIRSYSGLHFPAFRLNTERYSVSLRIQSECGKMRARKNPNTDTFHAVLSWLTSNIRSYNVLIT